MSSTTATIFLGIADTYHSGISPTHYILLSENSRPTLTLYDIKGKEKPRAFMPTAENILEDIYLMFAMFVLKRIEPPVAILKDPLSSLYDVFSKEERQKLYSQAIEAFEKSNAKIVFNILEGSSLNAQIKRIKDYPNDFEVTTMTMKKEYNPFSDKAEMKGI